MMEKDMEDKIEDILNSLDRIRRAEVPPFLWTRIESRISGIDNRNMSSSFIWKLAVSMLLVIGLNAWVITRSLTQKDFRQTTASVSSSSYYTDSSYLY